LQTVAVDEWSFGSSGRARSLTAMERAIAEPRVLEPTSKVSHGIKSSWASRQSRRLTATDAAVIITSVAIAQFARFGTDPATFRSEVLVYSYTAVSAVLILAWFSVLVLFRSREPRVVVSAGVEEFHRVARASIALFRSVALVSFLLKRVPRGLLRFRLT
jgi:hypothetical protein